MAALPRTAKISEYRHGTVGLNPNLIAQSMGHEWHYVGQDFDCGLHCYAAPGNCGQAYHPPAHVIAFHPGDLRVLEIYHEGDTIDQVELVNCSDPYYPPEGWGCGICDGVFEPCANRWINALAGSPSENAVFISQRLGGYPYPGGGCEVTKLRMDEEENLVEDTVIGTFEENMFGLAITPPARRPFVRLMGLDGRVHKNQTAFAPARGPSYGYSVGVSLNNLNIKFDDELSPSGTDQIHVQFMDNAPAVLTETSAASLAFDNGVYHVVLSGSPVLNPDSHEEIAATITHLPSGTSGREFLLHETAVDSGTFAVREVWMQVSFDDEDPTHLTFTVDSNFEGQDDSFDLYETSSGIYEDADGIVILEILFLSGLTDELDVLTVEMEFPGSYLSPVRATLLETGATTEAFHNYEESERGEMLEKLPIPSLFQVVGYSPGEQGSITGTLEAIEAGSLLNLTMQEGADGLFHSDPILGIQKGATSIGEIPEISGVTNYHVIEMGCAASDSCSGESDDLDRFMMNIGDDIQDESDGVKGILLVVGGRKLISLDWKTFPRASTAREWLLELKRRLDLTDGRLLIAPTITELQNEMVTDGASKYDYFFYFGHSHNIQSEFYTGQCTEKDFIGLCPTPSCGDPKKREIISSMTFEPSDVPDHTEYKLAMLLACNTGKSDTNVTSMITGMNAKTYVGLQCRTPAGDVRYYLEKFISLLKPNPDSAFIEEISEQILSNKEVEEKTWKMYKVWIMFVDKNTTEPSYFEKQDNPCSKKDFCGLFEH